MSNNDDIDLATLHEKIKGFLKEINAEIIKEDIEDHFIDVPIDVIFSSDDKLKLMCRILITEEWFHFKCLLMFHESLPQKPDDRIALWEELLVANFNFPELTYSIDEEKNVFVEADMPASTTLDYFILEFSSIALGIDHFYNELIPKLNEQINKENTADPARLYT
ncbi:MAG: hypothetical protein EAX96_13790 [Candidatus Lokiarchaeota archaeon]|nr:hypothetical protein [Candidatus Lokiarchaeota archaeon]